MNKNVTINFSKIFIYIYAFILMFQPDLSYYIKINGLIIYLIFTIMYLLRYAKKIFQYIKIKPIFWFCCLNVFFTIYYAIRTMIAGTSITDFMNLRIIQNLMPIILLVGVLIINIKLDNLNYTKDEKYQFIIKVALIQSLIAILMIIFPSFRNVAYNIFYNGSSEINEYISSGRLYGICDGNYTYSFQVLMAYLALFTLYYAFQKKEKKYYIFSFLILMVSVLNGRTGLIIYAIGFALFIFKEAILKGKITLLIKALFVLGIAILIGYNVIAKFAPGTMRLLVHAYNDIGEFLTNSGGDTETAQLVSGVKIPTGIINNLFGAGYRIYAHAGTSYGYEASSDIGYINDWFMAGIFSILLLYNSFIVLMKNVYRVKYNTNLERNIVFATVIYMLLSNVKGELFRSQMQVAVIILILVIALMEDKSKKKSRKY